MTSPPLTCRDPSVYYRIHWNRLLRPALLSSLALGNACGHRGRLLICFSFLVFISFLVLNKKPNYC